MNLVFLGTPDFAVPSLIALHQASHPILAVVTQPDRPAGRGRSVQISPVKREALRRGLRVMQPEKLDQDSMTALAALRPEILVVVAYGLILPGGLLRVPPHGCINLHASLLPRFRGAAPVAHAILRGERLTGVSTLLMDEGIDTGSILMQRETPLGPEETTGEVELRLATLGAELLAATVTGLARGTVRPRPQEIDRESYSPKIRPESARLDWRRPAVEVMNRIRAFNPRPGAFTTHHGRLVKLWRATGPEAGSDPDGATRPGTVLSSQGRMRVVCGDATTLEIREIQMEGRRRVSGEEALRGRWFIPGDGFDESAESSRGAAGSTPAGL